MRGIRGAIVWFGRAFGVGVVVSLMLAGTALAAAPPNNAFNNATPFGNAPGQVIGTNVDATRQGGEPDNGNKTVWWKWTAPDSARYRLDTCDTLPAFTSVLRVYTGPTVSNLVEPVTASSECADDRLEALAFDAVAGTEYRFSVGSYYSSDDSQNIRLSLRRTPLNDNFAAATAFPGGQGTAKGINAEATREAGEPDTGNSTIWWRWTAPTSDTYNVDTCASNPGFSDVLGVYAGSAVHQLQQPPAEYDDCTSGYNSKLSFAAVAGKVYHFAVGSYYRSESSQNIVLTVRAKACVDARKSLAKAKKQLAKAQKKVDKAKAKLKKAKSKKKKQKAKKARKKALKKLKAAKTSLSTAQATKTTACRA